MLNTNILNINPEIVCGIIARAKEFQAKEGVTFEEDIPNSEYEIDWMQLLADHRDDLTFREVDSVINELEPDQQIDLLTLFYIGRGDFENEEWSAARKEAKNNIAPNLAGYLLSHPQVAEYLETALSSLGFSCGEEESTTENQRIARIKFKKQDLIRAMLVNYFFGFGVLLKGVGLKCVDGSS